MGIINQSNVAFQPTHCNTSIQKHLTQIMTSTPTLFIGFLGPVGSHSHDSLLHLFENASKSKKPLQRQWDQVPFPTLRQLTEALQHKSVDAIWLPVENALEGSIAEALEATHLSDNPPLIMGEWIVPIRHALIQKNPAITPRHITSHPQALSQCRDSLIQRFGPQLDLHPTSSTSQAVTDLVNKPDDWAALGTTTAAHQHSLSIAEPNLSDSPHNCTRFQLLGTHLGGCINDWGASPEHNTPNDASIITKTSLCMSLQDRPGALVDLLLVFKAYDVTMTRIESRPARQKMGDYLFYVDVAADLTQPNLDKVRMYLEAESPFIHISNAYPSTKI